MFYRPHRALACVRPTEPLALYRRDGLAWSPSVVFTTKIATMLGSIEGSIERSIGASIASIADGSIAGHRGLRRVSSDRRSIADRVIAYLVITYPVVVSLHARPIDAARIARSTSPPIDRDHARTPPTLASATDDLHQGVGRSFRVEIAHLVRSRARREPRFAGDLKSPL